MPDDVFAELSGAQIIQIGTMPAANIEGGGLIIDCRLPGTEKASRLILGMNELGMWLVEKCCVEPRATRA